MRVTQIGLWQDTLTVEQGASAFIQCPTVSVAWDVEPEYIRFRVTQESNWGRLYKRNASTGKEVRLRKDDYFTMLDVSRGDVVSYKANPIWSSETPVISDMLYLKIVTDSDNVDEDRDFEFLLFIMVTITNNPKPPPERRRTGVDRRATGMSSLTGRRAEAALTKGADACCFDRKGGCQWGPRNSGPQW